MQRRKTMIVCKARQLFILIASVILLYDTACAELIFSAPPRESEDLGRQTYAPVARYLETVLGEDVRYVHPGGWMQYSANMRKGKYDIVFDGPHFAAWRMKHIGHVPIARLPGNLTFYVITKSDNKRLKSITDLKSTVFCGLASPNLGTVLIYSYFESSIIYPEIYEVKGGFKAVYKVFIEDKNGKKCRAAVVRDNIYKRLSKEEKKQLKVIFKSQALPNQTLTVSKALYAKAKNLPFKMTTKAGNKSGLEIFNRFSKKEKYFQETKTKEYRELGKLLESSVWGW